jgi:glycosyltransferase involved in cell wall biosynthesis
LLSESEGLPNAVLEYMASGLPVLVTRLPFIDEIVRDQHNGLIVNEASPSSVAHAMLALARSAETRARMGSAGRAMVEDGVFHPDQEARGTESLLTRVVAAREVESSPFDDPGRVVARRR